MTLSLALRRDAKHEQPIIGSNIGHNKACTVFSEFWRDERVEPLVPDLPIRQGQFIFGRVPNIRRGEVPLCDAASKADGHHQQGQHVGTHDGPCRTSFERLTPGLGADHQMMPPPSSPVPASTTATMDMSLMRMFREGPEVSLNGSPMVSPMTAAS